MKIKTLITNFISLFYPDLCVVCRKPLMAAEKYFCLHCLIRLPVTNYHHCPQKNSVTERLEGKVPFERAVSFLFYNKGGIGQPIIGEIKYKGNDLFAQWMGRYMAETLMSSAFFQGVDFLIPVPLHRKKLKKRGFNQAEMIARGVSDVTGIPVETTCLFRKMANTTQTKKSSYERWLNTIDIFAVKNNEILDGKSILLIDDVFTTGSTIESCIRPLGEIKNIKIGILTLSTTQ